MNAEIPPPRVTSEEADVVAGSAKTRSGIVSGRSFRQCHVEFSVVENRAIFEGDIELGFPDDLAAALEDATTQTTEEMNAAVVNDESKLWPNGRVPFEAPLATSPLATMVNVAVAHINQRTHAQLVPKTNTDIDYVTFEASAYCSSQVGRIGGPQAVHLSPAAVNGNAIHELSHVLGLWHEQSRNDRDQYVQIIWQNILTGYEHNFRQQINDGDDVGPYDYGSIMHYPREAFSANGQPTILPLAADAQIGQRDGLSDGDIAAINYLYPVATGHEAGQQTATAAASTIGTQFTVDLPPRSIKKIETDGWDRNLRVHWEVAPTSGANDMAPLIQWELQVGRGSAGDLRYYFTIENLTADQIEAEARYVMLGPREPA